MNIYAIVKIKGFQYKVAEGMTISVNRLSEKEGEKITFSEVLLYKNNDKVLIGSPHVSGVKVIAKIVEHLRGKKIEVYKFKAKSRYRRHIGFRSNLTKIFIEKIEEKKSNEKITPKKIISKKNTLKTKKPTQKKP